MAEKQAEMPGLNGILLRGNLAEIVGFVITRSPGKIGAGNALF
jgi:hypothetical protein